jgi:hypothetical protein
MGMFWLNILFENYFLGILAKIAHTKCYYQSMIFLVVKFWNEKGILYCKFLGFKTKSSKFYH